MAKRGRPARGCYTCGCEAQPYGHGLCISHYRAVVKGTLGLGEYHKQDCECGNPRFTKQEGCDKCRAIQRYIDAPPISEKKLTDWITSGPNRLLIGQVQDFVHMQFPPHSPPHMDDEQAHSGHSISFELDELSMFDG
jgi:hypothetical protein